MRKTSDGTSTPARVLRPSRQVLTDHAYEALKGMVMDHQFEPGERLNIVELGRQLDVSATPVREALARLESDGLVTKRPLSGYAVAPLLDVASLRGLFEIRNLLEPFAARRAATQASDKELDALGLVAASMQADDVGAAYGEYKTFAAHDTEFHALIARLSGNPKLEEVLAGLGFHWHLYRLHFAIDVGVDTRAEHLEIFESIRNRSPESAADAMEHHLKQSEARLIAEAEAAER